MLYHDIPWYIQCVRFESHQIYDYPKSKDNIVPVYSNGLTSLLLIRKLFGKQILAPSHFKIDSDSEILALKNTGGVPSFFNYPAIKTLELKEINIR